MKSGSCACVDGGAVGGEAFEDLLGALCPHEPTRVIVPGGGPVQDVGGEFFDVAVCGTPELVGDKRGEPPLDEIRLRPVRRGEVEVEPAVTQQPAMHERGLAGLRMVEDHVDVEVFGYLFVHLVQEGDEVDAGDRFADVGDDSPRCQIQGREEVAGAVALLVTSGPRRGGGQHEQGRSGALGRLNLGFLVDGEDGGGHRRAHLEGDEVRDLFHEVEVGRHPEGVLAPGFEPQGTPDLPHRGVADPVLGRQRARRPGVASGGALQRSSVARSSALRLISTVGRPLWAMAFLRCWRTTRDQLGTDGKFPISQDFWALQPSGALGDPTIFLIAEAH